MPFKTEKGLEYISLFNNAADENAGDEDEEVELSSPSVLLISLDREKKIAKLVRRLVRPDGDITRYSGNSNFLQNGNLFVGWGGDLSYATEHGPNNEMVMEASFRSERFTTWRMFKADFKGIPTEAPVLQCEAHGASAARATTVCWVSQNGATEVRRWKFRSAPETDTEEGGGKDIKTVQRTGFETRVQAQGYKKSVFVEALDENDKIIGVSLPVIVSVPQSWSHDSEDKSAHAELR